MAFPGIPWHAWSIPRRLSALAMAQLLPQLKLPAPPAKRQKREAQPHASWPSALPAVDPPAAEAPASPSGESDEAFEPQAPISVPNDVSVALLVLKKRFPAEAKVAPFATRAQLYSLLTDRTAADRQLEELRRSNAVRLFQLPAAGRSDDQAVMLTSDYVSELQRCKQELLGQQQQTGSAPGGSGSSQGGQRAAEALDWFASRVLPACTELMITHGELVSLLAGPARGGAAGAAGRGPGGAAAAASDRAGASSNSSAASRGAAVTDAHVSLLLSQGCLTRHTASADSYLFSMPRAGAAVRSVAAGRQEILSLLQRRRHPELLESELRKKKLQRSVLGAPWHVADMVGGGCLQRLPSAVGPLLRVAKRGG